MSDRVAVLAAISIAIGAWLAGPPAEAARVLDVVTPAIAVATALALAFLVGFADPRTRLGAWRIGTSAFVCLAALVSACGLGARAWAGLELPASASGGVRAWATLVSDPVRVPGGVMVDVRVEGRRLRAEARGAPGDSLAQRAAGERLLVQGSVRALDAAHRERFASKHLAGRLEIESVDRTDPGRLAARTANGIRRTLMRGVSGLSPPRRALFAGVVIGDDRDQDPGEVEDFRAAGLSHVLAVSGQNVSFVLALAAPVLASLGLRTRLIAALAVLALFGTVTRWEPSVLRAVAMSSIAVVASVLGRPVTATRVLALAVGALLLVDPLLVRSLGFLLSVGASLGIVWLGPRFARRLPEPLAITLAAQAGVAPLLLPVFGGIPLGSVPANLLAVPAAGPLMMWGIAAGLPAGVASGGVVATILHVPTRLLLAWIAGVARVAASIPFGKLTPRIAVLAAAVWVAAACVRMRWAGRTALVAVACCSFGPLLRPPPADGARLPTGASDRLWRRTAHSVVVTDGRAPPGRLLRALRDERVARVGVLVVTGRAKSAGDALAAVGSRIRVGLVLAPVDRQFGTGDVPVLGLRDGMKVRVGQITVTVIVMATAARDGRTSARPEVRVQVGSPGAVGARPP